MNGAEIVATIAVIGITISNVLWLRSVRFFVNTAISKNPTELAQREAISADKRPQPKKDPRPRPEGM